MNFYKHFLGDYARDTAHLSMLEHGAYRLMLDHYYATGKPLPADMTLLYRICKAASKAERMAVDLIAEQFFPVNDDGTRHNQRADEEIRKASGQADTNRRIAQEREDARKAAREVYESLNESCSVREPSHSHSQNHKEQKTRAESARKRGSRLNVPELPESWKAFCQKERPDLHPDSVFKQFADFWAGVPGQRGVKLDWDGTWRNWVRRESGVRAKPDYSSTIAKLTDGV